MSALAWVICGIVTALNVALFVASWRFLNEADRLLGETQVLLDAMLVDLMDGAR